MGVALPHEIVPSMETRIQPISTVPYILRSPVHITEPALRDTRLSARHHTGDGWRSVPLRGRCSYGLSSGFPERFIDGCRLEGGVDHAH